MCDIFAILFIIICVVAILGGIYLGWTSPGGNSTTIITTYTFGPPEADEIVITFKEDTGDNGKKVIGGEVAFVNGIVPDPHQLESGEEVCEKSNHIELKEDDTKLYSNFTVEPRGGGPRAV